MSGDVLTAADADGVRVLTFNRPDAANAFDTALYLAAADALDAAAADEQVRVVVLTGSGRSFCAGTDLREMATIAAPADEGTARGSAGEPFARFTAALAVFPKPLLAAVNGAAVGLGFTMLAHCDLVLLADDARLLAPFTAMGVAPEAASSYLFPRRVGRQRAAQALLTSSWVSAAEAVEWGFAVRACPAESLLAETLALARSIAGHPLPSLMATKRLLLDAEREGIARARRLEDEAFAALLRGPHVQDAILGRLGS